MRSPRTIIRLVLTSALLLFGMPFAALDAPVVPGGQAGDSAQPIWFSSGLETPAAPETGTSRKAPEASAAVVPGGAAALAGLQSGLVSARGGAVLGVGTPLYLSHCALLC